MQCAAVMIQELDRMAPPHNDVPPLPEIAMETAHPQVLDAAVSPPTIRLTDAGLDEQPHGALTSHE